MHQRSCIHNAIKGDVRERDMNTKIVAGIYELIYLITYIYSLSFFLKSSRFRHLLAQIKMLSSCSSLCILSAYKSYLGKTPFGHSFGQAQFSHSYSQTSEKCDTFISLTNEQPNI